MGRNFANTVLELRKQYPSTSDCLDVQKSIDKIISDKAYYALKDKVMVDALDARMKELNTHFAKLNCAMVIGNSQLQQTMAKADKYNAVAKNRIESDSKKQVKNRIIISSVVLLASLGIIIFVSKKVVK